MRTTLTLDDDILELAARQAKLRGVSLGKTVSDKSMRNLIGAIQEGLDRAVARKDINGVKFAAKVLLEAVDVLEQYFKGTYKPPGGNPR